MEFIRGSYNIRSHHYGCVLSVGNYDGLHPGHQHVIQQLVKCGKDLNLPVTIVGFEPHPLEFFIGDAAPPRLMSVREKVESMRAMGVDRFCCLRFNHVLANTEPEVFVEDILLDKLGAKCIIVGDDFRFGRNRRGDYQMLHQLCVRNAVLVRRIDAQLLGDDRISSTRIRHFLGAGDISHANRLLGREYSISGRVVRGNGNGRKWGFATANVQMKIPKTALNGIFVVMVKRKNGTVRQGVASLGIRPTIGGTRKVLEVHLLDFDQDLYGERIKVNFLKKLRDEFKFSSIEKMCEQVQQDILRARDFFHDRNSQITLCH